MPEDTTYKGLDMVITKEYILNNRTKAGAWTKSQIIALGVNYPPSTGWIDRAVGTEISEENARLFEKKKYSKKSGATSIKKTISKLRREELLEIKQQIDKHLGCGR